LDSSPALKKSKVWARPVLVGVKVTNKLLSNEKTPRIDELLFWSFSDPGPIVPPKKEEGRKPDLPPLDPSP
jgi:hypothetical protein